MKRRLIKQIPCVFKKPSVDGHFVSISEGYVDKLNTKYYSTITARYYKGIGGSGDNMVLEVFKESEEEDE